MSAGGRRRAKPRGGRPPSSGASATLARCRFLDCPPMTSRKEQKERLKAERLQREQEAAAAERRKRLVGYGAGGGLAVAAIAAVIVAIAASGGGDGGSLSGGVQGGF